MSPLAGVGAERGRICGITHVPFLSQAAFDFTTPLRCLPHRSRDDGRMRSVRGLARRALQVPVARFRRGGWSALTWTLRLTVAAVAAFALAEVFFPGTQPLLAPLTALLVVQLTPVSLLASGADRVISVVAGVSVAAVFSSAVQLTWWSLAIVIAVSLLVGQALRLGSNLIEVPISAMLVLGVGSLAADSAAWQRITETLVGAGAGVAANLVFPPKVRTKDAGAAIDGMARDLAELLDRAGADLADPATSGAVLADRAAGWLDAARTLTHDIPNVGTALLRAEEGRRLNLRAVGTPDPGPGLRHGMEALEHSAVAVRSMFRSLLDGIKGGSWPGVDFGPELGSAAGLLLHEFAAGIRAFGRLVRVDAQPHHDDPPEIARLREASDGLLEARARISDMLLADDDSGRSELNFALLTTAKRLIAELDLDEHIRRQSRPRPSPLRRITERATRGGHLSRDR
jgi:Aromatic acid exporter family member 1